MLHLALSKPCLRRTDHEEVQHDLVNSKIFLFTCRVCLLVINANAKQPGDRRFVDPDAV